MSESPAYNIIQISCTGLTTMCNLPVCRILNRNDQSHHFHVKHHKIVSPSSSRQPPQAYCQLNQCPCTKKISAMWVKHSLVMLMHWQNIPRCRFVDPSTRTGSPSPYKYPRSCTALPRTRPLVHVVPLSLPLPLPAPLLLVAVLSCGSSSHCN